MDPDVDLRHAITDIVKCLMPIPVDSSSDFPSEYIGRRAEFLANLQALLHGVKIEVKWSRTLNLRVDAIALAESRDEFLLSEGYTDGMKASADMISMLARAEDTMRKAGIPLKERR